MSPAKKTSKRPAKKTASTKKAPRVAAPAKKASAKKASAKKASAKKAPSKPARSSNETVAMVSELAEVAEAHAISELIVETASATITIRRGDAPPPAIHSPVHTVVAHQAAPVAAPPAPAAEAASQPEPVVDNGHAVTSPFVGTFYRSPNPDSAAYVEVGQRVDKGQVLCIVEAMKLMNEIEADKAGVISSILVENAEPVEYGQALFKIAP
jgi:acetyl-CoA carboxylase biotin carboxyl carrier protein